MVVVIHVLTTLLILSVIGRAIYLGHLKRPQLTKRAFWAMVIGLFFFVAMELSIPSRDAVWINIILLAAIIIQSMFGEAIDRTFNQALSTLAAIAHIPRRIKRFYDSLPDEEPPEQPTPPPTLHRAEAPPTPLIQKLAPPIFAPADQYAERCTRQIIEYGYNKGTVLPDAIKAAIFDFVWLLYSQNILTPQRFDSLSRPGAHQIITQLVAEFEDRVLAALRIYIDSLPTPELSPFQVSLASVFPVARVFFEMENALYQRPYRPSEHRGLFAAQYDLSESRRWAINRKHLTEKELARGERISPVAFPGNAAEMVAAYCETTPFYPLFTIPVPLMFGSQRLEHQFVLAPSGTGKTQLIQAQIAADLELVKKGEASLVIIESQGINRRETDKPTLIDNLMRLQVFARELKGKVTFVQPSADLGLNIFDMGQNDPKLTQDQRDVRATSVRSIVNMSLRASTKPQGEMLSYCVELAVLTEKPTLVTLLDILSETDDIAFKRTYKKELPQLDDILQRYFSNFVKGANKITKDACRSRVNGLFAEPLARSMFSKPNNDLRLIDEIEAGKIIVVNADVGRLGTTGTEGLGRFFIAQLLYASRSRQSTKPVFVYMDECHYFVGEDENIEFLLGEARKQDIGMIFATQDLVKIKSPVVRELLQKLAIEITHQEHKPKGVFDIKLRGRSDSIEVVIPPKVMEGMDTMTPEEFDEVHGKKKPPPALPPPPPPPQSPPPANTNDPSFGRVV